MQTGRPNSIAVIGGGPAGLMAAEVMAAQGLPVTVFDRMPSLGRKLLMAGRGGLNITHSEPMAAFVARYGAAAGWMAPHLAAFPPAALIDWCEGLGQPVFTGSSGRVFPRAMKASPLLRAWLARLATLGVDIRTRTRLVDLDGAAPVVESGGRRERMAADATVLALGGASWPRLGSDAGWTQILARRGVALAPFRPSNSGLKIAWSQPFVAKFEGQAIKTARFSHAGRSVAGEAVVTRRGLEGGPVYALSSEVSEALTSRGAASIEIDLKPDMTGDALAARLAHRRGKDSFGNSLRKTIGLSPVAIGLLRESDVAVVTRDPAALAALIKACPLSVTATAGLERAISSAGGIPRAAVDDSLMLRGTPGLFVAGEMLDWDAPTGGYLLQACFASGRWAGAAAAACALGRKTGG